jgi:hypothetical protein
MFYLEKSRVLSFFHAFLDELQSLLQVLPINGVLDLLVPPMEHGVVGGRHSESESPTVTI